MKIVFRCALRAIFVLYNYTILPGGMTRLYRTGGEVFTVANRYTLLAQIRKNS